MKATEPPPPPLGAPPSQTPQGEAPSFSLWWLAAALAALLGAVLLAAFWLRQRTPRAAARLAPSPRTQGAPGGSPAPLPAAKVASEIAIERAERSLMMVTVKFRLFVSNRADSALTNLRIAAELASARRAMGASADQLDQAGELTPLGEIARIGPHQTRSLAAQLQLPVGELEIFHQGNVPMFVPLLRLRLEGDQIDAIMSLHVVGIASGAASARLHPLPISGPPGSYQAVRARRIA